MISAIEESISCRREGEGGEKERQRQRRRGKNTLPNYEHISDQAYAGPVGVKKYNTEKMKKIYILIFLGQKQIILFTT